jgi:hypothetical protein
MTEVRARLIAFDEADIGDKDGAPLDLALHFDRPTVVLLRLDVSEKPCF